MDMFQLKLFESLAKTLNFSRTSEQFFISQPAVSQQIKKLESMLGVKLIQRSSHKVSLTYEGIEMLQYANQIISLASKAEIRMQNLAQGRVERIRIATISATTHQVCTVLSHFHKVFPLSQVDIDLLEGSELVAAAQNEMHDIYFAGEMMIPANGRYYSFPISQGSLALFAHKEIADTIDLSDWSTIEKHPFISVVESDTAISVRVRKVCRNNNCTPNIINYYNRAEAVLLSVDSGVGIAILPEALGYYYQLPNTVLLPLDCDDAKAIYVFACKKDNSSNACEVFKGVASSIYE